MLSLANVPAKKRLRFHHQGPLVKLFSFYDVEELKRKYKYDNNDNYAVMHRFDSQVLNVCDSTLRVPPLTLDLESCSSFQISLTCKGLRSQNMMKVFLTLPSTLFFSTLMTENLTVLERGLHWPTVTTSPILVLPKAGVK